MKVQFVLNTFFVCVCFFVEKRCKTTFILIHFMKIRWEWTFGSFLLIVSSWKAFSPNYISFQHYLLGVSFNMDLGNFTVWNYIVSLWKIVISLIKYYYFLFLLKHNKCAQINILEMHRFDNSKLCSEIRLFKDNLVISYLRCPVFGERGIEKKIASFYIFNN